jgi:hypothetical protein
MKYINSFYIIALFFVSLSFVSCSNLDESIVEPSLDNKIIYSETFTNSMGRFTDVSVKGDQKWEFSSQYSCMVITGFVDSNGDGTKENIENEDWLISPEVDLTGLLAAKISFEHAGSYFANVSQSTTLWVSEIYTGGEIKPEEWTQISITKDITNSSDFNFVIPEISLNQFVGKKIRVAFKYNSSALKAGTWEIKNFTIKSGEAIIIPPKDNGKGTEQSPFNVAGGMANQGLASWISGYIVGYVWSGNFTSYTFGSDTCTQATNLLIADTVQNIYIARCIPVQLPPGVVRTALNLPANKSLIGKKITLYGSLENYFGTAGLKSVSYTVLPDGSTVGIKPVEPIYSQSFANFTQGDFTINNVVAPTAIPSIWLTSATYGMVATAFKNPTNYASEAWLISPEIDLTSQATAKMRFEHAINFVTIANIKNEMTLHISTDNGVNWTPLTIPTYPAGNTWTYVSSGEINLSNYIGGKIKIAFKYLSTTTKAGTWEVKNFVVYK